jgi:rod shape-determining protein MreC
MRKSPLGYISIIGLLLLLMSLSAAKAEKVKSVAITIFAPIWEQLDRTTSFLHSAPLHAVGGDEKSPGEQVRRLELDNQLLKMQLRNLQEQLLHEIELQVALAKGGAWNSEIKEGMQKHAVDTEKLLSMHLTSVPAHVISRSPSSWNSSLWIDVGEEDNERLGRRVIAKNSPVLSGASVVGVVEYIGEKQSRIRLITDAGLAPSVRNVRGSMQNDLLLGYLDALIGTLEREGDFLMGTEAGKREAYVGVLKRLKGTIGGQGETIYLAKGELQGSSYPLWRKRGDVLKGVGFNCDVADDLGPARDLRTGQPIGQAGVASPMAILKVGDLLVTTGMDGVFPAGLPIAEVTKINILKEGDYMYELEAKPTAGHLEEITQVFVIPPV